MNAGLLLEAPSRRLRILWADDDQKLLKAERAHLRKNHELVCTADFESTVAKLKTERFDLLILDQQLPRDGMKEIYAGTCLAEMLFRGELGQASRNVQILFWTGSEAWVEDSGFNVEECPNCLGIVEKGGYPFDALDEYVCAAILALADSDEVEEIGTGGLTGSSVLREEWAGVVLNVDAKSFRSRLSAVGASLPDHEATLPFDLVSDAEQVLIEEGATFRWAMTIEEGDSGERVAISSVHFDRVPEISQAQVDEAYRIAREKRERREGPRG